MITKDCELDLVICFFLNDRVATRLWMLVHLFPIREIYYVYKGECFEGVIKITFTKKFNNKCGEVIFLLISRELARKEEMKG